MKKFTSIILTLTLILTFALPVSVFATAGQSDNDDNEISLTSFVESNENFTVENLYKVNDGELKPEGEQQVTEDGYGFAFDTVTPTTLTFAYKITNTSGKIFIRDVENPNSNTFKVQVFKGFEVQNIKYDDFKAKDIKINGVAATMEAAPSELPEHVIVNGKSYASYDEDTNVITFTFDKIGLDEEITLEFSIEAPEVEYPLTHIDFGSIRVQPSTYAQSNLWADEEHTFSNMLLTYNGDNWEIENVFDAFENGNGNYTFIGTLVAGQKINKLPPTADYEPYRKYFYENVLDGYYYFSVLSSPNYDWPYTQDEEADVPYVFANNERARLGVYVYNGSAYAQKNAYIQMPLPESLWTLAESASTTDKEAAFYISDNGQYNADTHTISWLIDVSTAVEDNKHKEEKLWALNTKVPYVEFTATHDIDDTAEGGYIKVEDITPENAMESYNTTHDVYFDGKSYTYRFDDNGEHVDTYVVDGYCDWCKAPLSSKGDEQGEIADTTNTEQTAVEDHVFVQTGEIVTVGSFLLLGAGVVALIVLPIVSRKKKEDNK